MPVVMPALTAAERRRESFDLLLFAPTIAGYPRSHRLEHHDGTAETFEQVRADFEAAWRAYVPGCTEADFREYRRQRDWTAWKYSMRAAAMKLPTQSTDGHARCFCGAEIVTGTTARHVIEHHSNAIAA